MTIVSALQGVILLQVISKTVSQFPMPMPFPFPPGAPGAPPMNMGPMPPPPFLPGAMGGPMNFPPQQKMPMVVMPYYSKSVDKAHNKIRRKKRTKKIRYDDSSYEDDSSSSSDEVNYGSSSKTKKRQVLTPVVSYVTKDGYVIYQKKIKKDKAKDWLEMNKRAGDSQEVEDGYEEKARLLKKLKKLKFTRRHHKNHH